MFNKIVISGLVAAAVGIGFIAITSPVWAQGGPGGNGAGQALHTPVAPGTGQGVMTQQGGMRWGASANTQAGQPGAAAMQANHAAMLPAADPAGLTQAEIEGLLFMREEEKLAHDVYTALYDRWGLTQFSRIAASEQTHTDSVKTLLDRYGVADTTSTEPGVFVNADLQSLYNELVARGSQSAAEALQVGGLIEEVDIRDLDARLAANDQADIAIVYANLRTASESHLRAFANGVAMTTGTAYEAQALSADAVAAILAGSNGHGAGNGQGLGGGPRRP